MTFQVAAIGSDGIIIGSDRKMWTTTTGPDPARFVQFDEHSKFIRSDESLIICACAGTLESPRLAREIVEESDPTMNDLAWHRHLEAKARSAHSADPNHDQMFVVRQGHLDQVIWMALGINGFAAPIKTRQCIGVHSSACFLTTTFYSKCPVAELKRLVLLALDFAASEYPTSVGDGYDLLLLTLSGATWESYGATDGRTKAIRQPFEDAARAAIFTTPKV